MNSDAVAAVVIPIRTALWCALARSGLHPDRVTRIVILRAADRVIPMGIVMDPLAPARRREPKPSN